MGSRSQTIVISGYYGFNNSGDEAVLQSILLALKEQGKAAGIHIKPVVLSVNPELTRTMYGVDSVHRMKLGQIWKALKASDGLVSGGGSLLQDVTGTKTIPYYTAIIKMAQWLGKPTFIYSQGIGPVNRRVFDPFIRSAFRASEYISVRDEESAQLLRTIGLTKEAIDVVPDPVMGLPLRAAETDSKSEVPLIGVSVRFWNENRSELDGLAKALRQVLIERESARVRFLPFHLPSDQKASEYVIAQLGDIATDRIEVARGVTHPQDMLGEVSRCSLLVGMRLHSLIYAASQYVPMVGISYDPKIDQFLNRLDMKAAASTESFSHGKVASEMVSLLDGAEAWKQEKHDAIERLKLQAQQPAQRIAAFLNNKG